MESKFWKLILVAIITFTVSQNIVNATTTNVQYYYNGTWTNYTGSAMPMGTTDIRIQYNESTIKNNKFILQETIQLDMPGKYTEGNIPEILVRYGTSSSYIEIQNQCSINKWVTYKQSDQLILNTYMNYVITCEYQGTNVNANWLQIKVNAIQVPVRYITIGPISLNVNGNKTLSEEMTQLAGEIMQNSGSIGSTILMQFNVNAAQQAAAMAANQIQLRSDISNSTQTTANNIEAAKQAILNGMGVSGTNFTYDTTEAQNLESAEGNLKGGMIDPNSLGINQYININPQDTSYQAGLTMIWDLISNLIGPLSAVWIITSILLTLGSIKLILSR